MKPQNRGSPCVWLLAQCVCVSLRVCMCAEGEETGRPAVSRWLWAHRASPPQDQSPGRRRVSAPKTPPAGAVPISPRGARVTSADSTQVTLRRVGPEALVLLNWAFRWKEFSAEQTRQWSVERAVTNPFTCPLTEKVASVPTLSLDTSIISVWEFWNKSQIIPKEFREFLYLYQFVSNKKGGKLSKSVCQFEFRWAKLIRHKFLSVFFFKLAPWHWYIWWNVPHHVTQPN